MTVGQRSPFLIEPVLPICFGNPVGAQRPQNNVHCKLISCSCVNEVYWQIVSASLLIIEI